jgi:membrane associated rhomboid family serine protease
MATCYRHPSRETGVSCSNCGRPICTDCMTTTSVGMRCPECSAQTTQVRRMRTSANSTPTVTVVIIAICVLAWFGGQSSGAAFRDGALFGPAVASGEWWRLVTSGFLHSGILHLGFNMYVLWFLGQMLETSLGSVRYAALYFAALLSGSFGALIFSPNALTVGASGAVFGLMAAAFVMQRARGIDVMQSGIGPLLLLNLAITFFPGLNISIGGHVGGLIGGALAAFLMDQVSRRRRGDLPAVAVCVFVGAVAVAGALTIV